MADLVTELLVTVSVTESNANIWHINFLHRGSRTRVEMDQLGNTGNWKLQFSTMDGIEGTHQHSWKLQVCGKPTLSSFDSILHACGRTEYQPPEDSSDCRFWIYNILYDFGTEGLIDRFAAVKMWSHLCKDYGKQGSAIERLAKGTFTCVPTTQGGLCM
ncbi:hypothetical protein BGW36DRAFT_431172 [Talaromyces proteolyticus]|uniref:DUF7770 domain-containing protein n=1 Tax=Talaromyces proteolyticus TaxID=1131652 RepID=A0AAD4KJS8_9EURO|nr:uncharacterized protein BGW36DRAFT_431172 [Talaromyces proteolyticus]KAH8691928.1 hypothetical protein BGW36DRAFT_431172 [Talaromyces proteolyticus]